ncbi:site-specific integrase [Noviherbaspirillum sp. CPCC 100848]|uniref:Site-specific integrase n=1 Tax=Noviherbaspirillum album TaxID=3080276 RepID=A0ABU6JGQ2_9BURK|nr:site-specific integrase [Noviherbaspirillum sp. CPCC 100848]MEC4722844.1 site-specific integrase [Noviherbaspirillum sp. CPCC 100848]
MKAWYAEFFLVQTAKFERQNVKHLVTDKFDGPMANIGSELDLRTGGTVLNAELTVQHRQLLAAATSDNTRRAYRSSINHFLAWGGRLPCEEPMIIAYLLAYAESLNPRTLSLRLTALSQWHLHQGFPNPASTPTVRKTMAGILRTYGKPKKKAKALPVEDLELIVSALANQVTLSAARDNALLQVGYFGGYRRSELVQLKVENLVWDRDGLVITLPRSKTDQEGKGIDKAIPFGDESICPVKALKTWLQKAGIKSGPLFRPISKSGMVGAVGLHPGSVNEILERGAKLAGLDYVPMLSSHSLRRGMATSAYRAGANPRDIKRQGGWRHDGTVQGYIEEASQFEENAAVALLRRKRKS